MGLLKFSQSGVELLRKSFRRYKKNGLIMNKVPEMAYDGLAHAINQRRN